MANLSWLVPTVIGNRGSRHDIKEDHAIKAVYGEHCDHLLWLIRTVITF